MEFVQMPDGNVYPQDADGYIAGAFMLDDKPNDLAALIRRITSTEDGLTDLACSWRVDGVLNFRGRLNPVLASRLKVLDAKRHGKMLRAMLEAQYGLSPVEAEHAMHQGAEPDDGNECVTNIHGTMRQMRSPAHPEECSQIRITCGPLEIGRWMDNEWQDDPACVMGAIMGALKR